MACRVDTPPGVHLRVCLTASLRLCLYYRNSLVCSGINEALTVARHFPSKRLLFNMDPDIVEERREELQLWMLVCYERSHQLFSPASL
eukprot:COSAG02_NODE_43_length_45989_cov_93.430181_50_plen_88_part_00